MSYATISYVLNEMICLDGREKARRTYNQMKLIEQLLLKHWISASHAYFIDK